MIGGNFKDNVISNVLHNKHTLFKSSEGNEENNYRKILSFISQLRYLVMKNGINIPKVIEFNNNTQLNAVTTTDHVVEDLIKVNSRYSYTNRVLDLKPTTSEQYINSLAGKVDSMSPDEGIIFTVCNVGKFSIVKCENGGLVLLDIKNYEISSVRNSDELTSWIFSKRPGSTNVSLDRFRFVIHNAIETHTLITTEVNDDDVSMLENKKKMNEDVIEIDESEKIKSSSPSNIEFRIVVKKKNAKKKKAKKKVVKKNEILDENDFMQSFNPENEPIPQIKPTTKASLKKKKRSVSKIKPKRRGRSQSSKKKAKFKLDFHDDDEEQSEEEQEMKKSRKRRRKDKDDDDDDLIPQPSRKRRKVKK